MLICKAVVGADSTTTGTRGFVKHSFCAVANLMLQYGLQGPPWDGTEAVGFGTELPLPIPGLDSPLEILIATTVNSKWGMRGTLKRSYILFFRQDNRLVSVTSCNQKHTTIPQVTFTFSGFCQQSPQISFCFTKCTGCFSGQDPYSCFSELKQHGKILLTQTLNLHCLETMFSTHKRERKTKTKTKTGILKEWHCKLKHLNTAKHKFLF